MNPSSDDASVDDSGPERLAAPGESPGPPPRSRVPLIVGTAILAVLLVAGGITAIVFLGGDGEEDPGVAWSSTVATNEATASGAGAANPSDESDGSAVATDPSEGEPAPAGTDPAEGPATAAPGGFDETNAIWTEEPAAWTPLPNSDWNCLGIVGNRYMSPSTNCLYTVADGHDAFYAAGMYASEAIAADPGDLPTMATLVVRDWIETEFSTAHGLTVTGLTGTWTSLDGETAAIATGRAAWAATSPQPYGYVDVVVVMHELDAGRFFIGIGSAPEPYPGGPTELENSLLATVFV